MLRPFGNTSDVLNINDRWVMEFIVLDDDGELVTTADDFVATHYSPSTTTVLTDPELLESIFYRIVLTLDEIGSHAIEIVSATYGAVTFAAFVDTSTYGYPDISDVMDYLAGGGDVAEEVSIAQSEVENALAAEKAAQQRVCRVPAPYPSDLSEALKRRVARNLALRRLPVMVLQGDAETGSLIPPGRDPEVRRLEAPFRRLVQP